MMRGKKTKGLWENKEYKDHMSKAHMKDKPGYSAIHKWVSKWKVKPDSCQYCGRNECRIEWANIDHTYKRVLDDYIALCVRCHLAWDREHNNRESKNQFS